MPTPNPFQRSLGAAAPQTPGGPLPQPMPPMQTVPPAQTPQQITHRDAAMARRRALQNWYGNWAKVTGKDTPLPGQYDFGRAFQNGATPERVLQSDGSFKWKWPDKFRR